MKPDGYRPILQTKRKKSFCEQVFKAQLMSFEEVKDDICSCWEKIELMKLQNFYMVKLFVAFLLQNEFSL
jgi:hypothetical protein